MSIDLARAFAEELWEELVPSQSDWDFSPPELLHNPRRITMAVVALPRIIGKSPRDYIMEVTASSNAEVFVSVTSPRYCGPPLSVLRQYSLTTRHGNHTAAWKYDLHNERCFKLAADQTLEYLFAQEELVRFGERVVTPLDAPIDARCRQLLIALKAIFLSLDVKKHNCVDQVADFAETCLLLLMDRDFNSETCRQMVFYTLLLAELTSGPPQRQLRLEARSLGIRLHEISGELNPIFPYARLVRCGIDQSSTESYLKLLQEARWPSRAPLPWNFLERVSIEKIAFTQQLLTGSLTPGGIAGATVLVWSVRPKTPPVLYLSQSQFCYPPSVSCNKTMISSVPNPY